MKRKIILSLCASVSLLFSATDIFAGVVNNVFPMAATQLECTAPTVVPDDTAPFCASFTQSVLTCSEGLNMQQSYHELVNVLGDGSLINGCKLEARLYGANWQACVGEWQCYVNGGKSYDLSGNPACSGTGNDCPHSWA